MIVKHVGEDDALGLVILMNSLMMTNLPNTFCALQIRHGRIWEGWRVAIILCLFCRRKHRLFAFALSVPSRLRLEKFGPYQ
jgi:hypothetical protein